MDSSIKEQRYYKSVLSKIKSLEQELTNFNDKHYVKIPNSITL